MTQQIRISALPSATSLGDTDVAPVVQGSGSSAATRRMTLSTLRGHMQRERTLHVRDYGAVGGGTTDETAAVQAALDAARDAGGGIVQLGPRRHRIGAAGLEVHSNVTLQGSPHIGGQRTGADYSATRYALLLDPAGGIRMRRNAGLTGIALLRQGLGTVTTLRQALTEVAAFAGTAVTIGNETFNNGSDARVERMLILGFETAIRATMAQRVSISDVAADCTNGIVMRESYDVSRVSNVHLWGFVTTNLDGITNATFTVSGVTNAGGTIRVTTSVPHGLIAGDIVHVTSVGGVTAANGKWTVAVPAPNQLDLVGSSFSGTYSSGGNVIIHVNRRSGTGFRLDSCDAAELRGCFSYGHQTGFRIEGSSMATQLMTCGYDDLAELIDTSTVGLSIGGNAFRTTWTGGYIFSAGTSIVADSGTPKQQNHSLIVAAKLFGGHFRAIEMRRGGLTVSGCQITRSVTPPLYQGRVWIADTADNLTILGTDARDIMCEGQSATALSRIVLGGNRIADTGGAHQLAGGNFVLQTTDAGSASGLTTRVEIGNDGATTFRRRSASLGARISLADPANAVTFALGAQTGATVFETGTGTTTAERLRIANDGTITLSSPLVLSGNPAAALHAATRGYVDAQFTERRTSQLAITTATALTHAAHNARLIIVRPGGTLSATWAATGDGFSCLILNLTGADLAISLSGFSPASIQNPDTHTRVKAGGLASLLAVTPDGGTTRMMHLAGATAA